MAHDGQDLAFHLNNSLMIVDLLTKTRRAADELSTLFETARQQMKAQIVVDGKTSGKLLEENQDAVHGLAGLQHMQPRWNRCKIGRKNCTLMANLVKLNSFYIKLGPVNIMHKFWRNTNVAGRNRAS